jgi:hypothetical protein
MQTEETPNSNINISFLEVKEGKIRKKGINV